MSIDQLNHHEFRAFHGAFRTWHVGGLVAVVVCDVADGLSLHSSSDFLICDQVSAAAEGPWSDPREPDLQGLSQPSVMPAYDQRFVPLRS